MKWLGLSHRRLIMFLLMLAMGLQHLVGFLFMSKVLMKKVVLVL